MRPDIKHKKLEVQTPVVEDCVLFIFSSPSGTPKLRVLEYNLSLIDSYCAIRECQTL